MITKIIEATNGFNWGKFMLARFDAQEWARPTHIEGEGGRPMLPQLGWDKHNIWVLDLQTGEGAMFKPHGIARIDLNEKHKIWVCPLYEPFLCWVYQQDLSDINKLPDLVQLPEAEGALYGYRRKGPEEHGTEETDSRSQGTEQASGDKGTGHRRKKHKRTGTR
jgi:hypothetical protein